MRVISATGTARQRHFCSWSSPLLSSLPGILHQPAAAAAKSLQSCPTLCNPIDSSPPGSPVPGILQARTQEWVAISLSNAGKWKVKGKSLNRVRLLAIPWTAAYQAPLSMGFARQEYGSGLPLPHPMHESEKWKWSLSVVSDSSRPPPLKILSRTIHLPLTLPPSLFMVICILLGTISVVLFFSHHFYLWLSTWRITTWGHQQPPPSPDSLSHIWPPLTLPLTAWSQSLSAGRA